MTKLVAATTTTFILFLTFCVRAPEAFVIVSNGAANTKNCQSISSTHLWMAILPTPEEAAKALTAYMAKAHEEKLRAVTIANELKNAEIKALKEEIKTISASSSPVTSSNLVVSEETSHHQQLEQLSAKLFAYQKFMSEYVVRSQQDKYNAVKAAEAAIAKKYEDRLLLLGDGPPSAELPTLSHDSAPSTNNKRYMDRNAKVSAAAAAGKSRWGIMETQRAASGTSPISSTPVASAPDANVNIPAAINGAAAAGGEVNGFAFADFQNNPPPEIVAADHGLRSDGGVGGPTLAERVVLGSNAMARPAMPKTTLPVMSTNNELFQKRNAKVIAAAKAGKSRWGEKEIQRSNDLTTRTISPGPAATASAAAVKEEVTAAADHTSQSFDGIGGPSLSKRVNLGARLFQNPM